MQQLLIVRLALAIVLGVTVAAGAAEALRFVVGT